MRVKSWLDNGRGVVEISGEVDIYTAPELRAAISDAGSMAGRPGLVVLLAELAFMDSTGLGLLVAAHKRAVMGGGRVALVGTRGNLLRVLQVTGLSTLMPSFDDAGAAMAWLDEQDAESGSTR
jgi:anti-sigma B factor antagonist